MVSCFSFPWPSFVPNKSLAFSFFVFFPFHRESYTRFRFQILHSRHATHNTNSQTYCFLLKNISVIVRHHRFQIQCCNLSQFLSIFLALHFAKFENCKDYPAYDSTENHSDTFRFTFLFASTRLAVLRLIILLYNRPFMALLCIYPESFFYQFRIRSNSEWTRRTTVKVSDVYLNVGS